ncbi:MAG: cytochrome P450 [Alphaproteobacteria bacterium]
MAYAGLADGRDRARRPPTPESRFPLSQLRALRTDPLRFLIHCRAAHGDVVWLRLRVIDAYLLSHPDHIHHVLQTTQSIYDKNLAPLERLRPILGHGMVTADGTTWKQQREVAQPAFRGREIQSFGPIITEVIADTIPRWRQAAVEGAPLDMHREMLRMALCIVGKAMFGVDLRDHAEASGDLLEVTMTSGVKRVRALIAAPMFLPTPNNRRIKSSRRALETMIDRIVEERRAGQHDEPCLLDRLLEAHGALEKAGRSAQFYDEAITILLAGHETTANALAFSLHLLGRHPSVVETLRAETRRVLGRRPAEIGDLPALTYTRMVIDEAMRLYPPAWIIDRNTAKDDEIDGYPIKQGSLIMVSPWVIHRHPAFWPDSERFDPERFAKDRHQDRPRHAYLPFGLGPRVCIGASLALTEAVMVLASLIDLFDVEPVSGHMLRLDPNVTLRPKNGLPMTVRSTLS